MRKIFLALAGLAFTVLGSIEVCQKNCGIDYGKCLITTFDMETCTKQEASCALDCFKGLSVQTNQSVHHHHHHHDDVQVQGNMEVCQKNCGIESAKCLITTFDMKGCAKQEASCALDCLKGV